MGRCRDHPLAVDFEQQTAADMRETATVQQSINWPNGRFEIRHGLRRALLNPRLRRLFQALDYHRSYSPRLAGHLACAIARSPGLDESVPLVPGDELFGQKRCRTAGQKKIGL